MWRYAGMADRIVTIRWPTPSAWVVVASEDAVAGGARWAVAAAVAVLALAACTATKSTGQQSTSTSPTATSSSPASGATSSSSSAAPAPALVTLLPASGTAGVSPIAPIRASVSGGTLTSVTLTNDDGTGVIGTMAADRTSWTAGQPLGYGKRYTLTAHATNGAGDTVTKTSAFGTVTPGNMTMAYINTAAGYALNPARTYGVGQAIKVHFDEPIRNKAAAERALSVTTVPPQVGGWNWFSDQDVHWRPKVYFTPHTRVTVTAKIYGVQVGPGLYGQADTSTSFRIGEAQISQGQRFRQDHPGLSERRADASDADVDGQGRHHRRHERPEDLAVDQQRAAHRRRCREEHHNDVRILRCSGQFAPILPSQHSVRSSHFDGRRVHPLGRLVGAGAGQD